MCSTGVITNIQRFSTQDGPGVRTTVFLKGCPLRCYWCHNPETQHPGPQLQFFAARCIGCGGCDAVCPAAAGGRRAAFTAACRQCGRCAAACSAEALQMVGYDIEAQQLWQQLARDAGLFALSGGGVTFSGGEPFMQPAFLLACLRQCKAAGIHTAVETALAVPWRDVEACLPYIDLFLCDIKAMDPALHRTGTGQDNGMILENIRRLCRQTPQILFRTPVVPGFNDTEGEIAAICDFVAALPGSYQLELLEFHNWCENKYTALHRSFAASGRTLEKEDFARLRLCAEQKGVLYHEQN